MIKCIDHIGIAVDNLEEAKTLYSILLDQDPYYEQVVESQGVRVAFINTNTADIELLEPLNKDSTIQKFIDKNGPGLHHLAFLVDNLENTIKSFKNKGFKMIHESPQEGANGKKIAFLHPRNTGKVLIELCQKQ